MSKQTNGHTVVQEERSTQCPPAQAGAHVRAFFAGLGSDETVRLRLTARLTVLGINVPVNHEVIARTRRYSDNDHIAEIEWDPQSKLLPHFNGIITVAAGADDEHCRLVLNGVYVPPLNWVGEVFDRMAGWRLAKTTASELLERIGRQVEAEELVAP
jgi:hypothetical protein